MLQCLEGRLEGNVACNLMHLGEDWIRTAAMRRGGGMDTTHTRTKWSVTPACVCVLNENRPSMKP